jgi:glutaredoxin
VRRVVMYSRRTCGLCDKARAVLDAERARTPFEFREVFIDGRDDLERDYGLRVPVVEIDGRERFEYHVDPGAFAQAIRA